MLNTRKQIRLKSFDYKNDYSVYFVTICTADKESYFSNKSVAKEMIDALMHRNKINEIRLYCYCLMPNHLHILISLGSSYSKRLNNWIAAFKRYTSKIARDNFNINPLWQVNFYDHVIRKEESLLDVAEYLLNNPVRKGFVKKWSDYPYSKLIDELPI